MLQWLAIVVLIIIQYFVWLVTWQLIEDPYKFKKFRQPNYPDWITKPVEFIEQNHRVIEKGCEWISAFLFSKTTF